MKQTRLCETKGAVDFIDVSKPIEQKNTFTVASFFSGCGGMDLGFVGDFYFLGRHYEKNPFEIIFSNDIVPQACQTYEHNLKTKCLCEDVKKINLDQIPSPDIVIGGFPCQDFSLSGKRKGFATERGRLYLELKKIIDYHKPKMFIAENVDGLRTINNDGNSALKKIIKDFESSGYVVDYKILNAADYGVPQTRVRIIIIGVRTDLKITPKFPKAEYGDYENKPWVTSKEAIDDLWWSLDNTAIPNHTSKDYSRAKFYDSSRSQGNNRISAERPAPTIRSEHHGNIEGHYRTNDENNPDDKTKWRRLSIRECARLQSFPDDFEFPVSQSHAYKEIGNAVPPVLAWYISRAVYLTLFSNLINK